MKRVATIGLTFIATCMLGGIATTPSLAGTHCFQVTEIGTGKFSDALCSLESGVKNYIFIKGVPSSRPAYWCAETLELNKGNYTDTNCVTGGMGKYIRVMPGRLGWQLLGQTLKGKSQIKRQNKGAMALSMPAIGLTVTCLSSVSENAVIETGGSHQDQGKGSMAFTSCKTSAKECTVSEAITTNPLKSYLATPTGGESSPIVEVFEPSQGSVLATFKISGCVAAGTYEIKGKTAAGLMPVESEAKEGLAIFPKEATKIINHEGVEEKLGLTAAGFEIVLSGVYGAKLATGESFGVYAS